MAIISWASQAIGAPVVAGIVVVILAIAWFASRR